MFAPAGCRCIDVEPRASDHGYDRAGIEVEGPGDDNALWFDIEAALTSRSSGGSRPGRRRGLR